MDEYKQYVYNRNPDRWNSIDAGDLSYMLGVKSKLNCKPFKYFLEEVAPDMLECFPPVEPPSFAFGGVRLSFKFQRSVAKELQNLFRYKVMRIQNCVSIL